jgi:hypothetical protein
MNFNRNIYDIKSQRMPDFKTKLKKKKKQTNNQTSFRLGEELDDHLTVKHDLRRIEKTSSSLKGS